MNPFFLLFIGLPALEIFLMIKIGGVVGAFNTVILIFLTAIIFLFISFTKSFGEENVFTINNVKVKGVINVNFSREKYLNKAFSNTLHALTPPKALVHQGQQCN